MSREMSCERVILLADMESFYASVEAARNPSIAGKPVVVCGDPERRHGIVLAASKEAKACGVKTGMLAWQCRGLCPDAVFVRPHMQLYLEVSLKITAILSRFTDRLFPYSIDEQFLDISGCDKLFGSPEEMAGAIRESILQETGVNCRTGAGDNPLQAKMACDRFAKRNTAGYFRLSADNYSHYVWPLPVEDLFGVGSRMKKNLHRMGIRTIGHLAALPRDIMKQSWGINGEVLWLNAHGTDYSLLSSRSTGERDNKGVGHSMTLPRDYREPAEIETVMLELTEEVCRRVRSKGQVGKVVHLYCQGADFVLPGGFSRQRKLPEPTAGTMDIYPVVQNLFYTHWNRRAVRALGISVSGLTDGHHVQLSLLEDKERKIALNRAMDTVWGRFGRTSLFRLTSLTSGSQLFAREGVIGGHEA